MLTFATRLKRSLLRNVPKGKVEFMPGWNKMPTGPWRGPRKVPVALVLHHTAGAATTSTDPKNPGNQKGANAGVVNYVQNHYPVPAANFTLDRDGTVYVHCAYPVWHAGMGTFMGKFPWNVLGVPKDMGNKYMLGVEIVSRGTKKDFTTAQKISLVGLQESCGDAAGWPKEKRRSQVRRPRHKDWTDRKIDILYTQEEIDRWMS